MPEIDGYELARAIRGIESGNGSARTPIIACTANAMRGEAEICLAAGMDDYLAKPVELAELLRELDHWLPLPPKPTARRGPRTPAQGTAPLATRRRRSTARRSPRFRGGDAAAEREILRISAATADEDAASLAGALADRGYCGEITRVPTA